LIARLGLHFSLLLCCFTILGSLFNKKNLLFFSTLASLQNLVVAGDLDQTITLKVEQEFSDLVVNMLEGLR
jgi:hypothetical protein